MVYFICHPGGDKSKLSVCFEENENELKCYDLATNKVWFMNNKVHPYSETALNNAIDYLDKMFDNFEKHNMGFANKCDDYYDENNF